jgi:Ion channel
MAVVVKWMQARAGDTTFNNADGYWFAYISSTTVGFGDIYLPAEVFLFRDLLTFPLMWLVGFVLVAAFIAKFADTWIAFLGRRSYVVDVLDRLHKTHMLHDLPSAGEIVSEHWRKRLTSCCPRADVDKESRQATSTAAPDDEIEHR